MHILLRVLQIDQSQFNKILGLINAGKEEGATLVAGGEQIGNRGFYIQPTVFSDVKARHYDILYTFS